MSHLQSRAHPDAARLAKPLDHAPSHVTVVPLGGSAFTSRLAALGQLSAQDVVLLQGLTRSTRRHAPQAQIGPDARSMVAWVVVSGWACRQRLLGDGRRQIISLILPGDPIGNLEHPEPPSSDVVVALTPVITADASPLVSAARGGNPAHGGLARAVRLLEVQEMALLRAQIVRLGRQTAYERLVHCMLELHARLKTVGLATSDSFPMPLSQEVLGDVLGLSVVHVIRTMRQVRQDGLLETQSAQVGILDLETMRIVADWTPPTVGPVAL